jgi:transposase
LNGVTVIVKAAHVRLCHSRMLFVRVYPRETQEMVFDAHDRAFALFKGASKRLRRRSPKGHQRSLRDVAAELVKLGFVK